MCDKRRAFIKSLRKEMNNKEAEHHYNQSEDDRRSLFYCVDCNDIMESTSKHESSIIRLCKCRKIYDYVGVGSIFYMNMLKSGAYKNVLQS